MPSPTVACCRRTEHKQQGNPAMLPPASGALRLRGTPVQRLHPQPTLTTFLWICPTPFECIYIFDLYYHPVGVSSTPYDVWHEKILHFILNLLPDSFTWYPSAPIFRQMVNNCLPFPTLHNFVTALLSWCHLILFGTEAISLQIWFPFTLTFPNSINSFLRRETNYCIKCAKKSLGHAYWFTET